MEKHFYDIKNQIAYFRKVVKNMDLKDSIKQSKINAKELQLDEVSYDNYSCDLDLDKHLQEQGLLDWIEFIENQKLYEVIKALSVEDQIFISYIFKECKIQSELSEIYGINQSRVCDRLNKIIRVIKYNLFNK